MTQPRFMTGPLSILLDLVRGMAALAVVVGHTVQLGLYTGPYPFTIAFQHNAVLIFFVVSGLVIAASVEGGRTTLTDYAVARFSRILPVALPALVFAALVTTIDAAHAGGPLFAEDAGGVKAQDLLLSLAFLSETWRTGLPMNPPFWSLCYEVWYYAMFAAAVFLRGPKRIAFCVLFALIAGPNALLSLPVWLAGVAAARWTALRRVPEIVGAAFVALALVGLWILPLLANPLGDVLRLFTGNWILGYSLYAPSDALLGVMLALGFIGLRTIVGESAPALDRWSPPIRWFANISFSLYILHWPLMKAVRLAGFEGTQNPAVVAVLVITIVAVCAGFASLTEQRRHALRAQMRRWLDRDRAIPAEA